MIKSRRWGVSVIFVGLWSVGLSACAGTDDDSAVQSVESAFTTATRCNSRADCPAIANATATCSNRRCSYACNTNFKQCSTNTCVPAAGCCVNSDCLGTITACGGTCGTNHVCSFPSVSCGAASCSSASTVIGAGTCSAGACVFPAPRTCSAGLVCSAGSCSVPPFTTLGTNNVALAVNGDGSVVIGSSLNTPFRWTRAGGIVNLALPQGASLCSPSGVSADGTTVVGDCDNFPTRWSGTTPVVLGLALGTIDGYVAAANVDGSILTGVLVSANGVTTHSGLWTNGATTALLAEPAGSASSGTGISGDGSVIVGNLVLSSDTTGLGQAYRWTRSSGVMGLVPFIPGTPAFSRALGVSADGNKVLFLSKGFGSAVWTASTNALTVLPSSFTPRAISGDGTTVAGNDSGGPAIWSGGTTSADLTTRLTSLGANLGDFVLVSVAGVSTNGKVIVGVGRSNSTGIQQGWVVVLP